MYIYMISYSIKGKLDMKKKIVFSLYYTPCHVSNTVDKEFEVVFQ